MNFDFLKDVKSLAFVYKNCNSAEELANMYPESSLVASRRGAEALARLIYMTAHKEEMEHLTFDTVLKDQAVRRFIHNRDVLDAFYNIKQKGNKGAHVSEEALTAEDAIDVLWDLHYVTGETAIKMKLVDDYPKFDENIGRFPDAKELDEENIENKVMEMFSDYVQQYNKELDEANYYSPTWKELSQYLIEGNVDIHEKLIFDHRPEHIPVMEYIQDFLLYLFDLAIDRSPEISEAPVSLDVKIRINGDHIVSIDNLDEYYLAVVNELPKACEFTVDSHYVGKLREIYYRDDDEEWSRGKLNRERMWDGNGMLNKLESFKRKESFYYSMIQFLPDSGNIGAAAIINGKSKDVQDLMSTDILTEKDRILDCDGFWINVAGKKSITESPELFESLKAIIRDNIYEESIEYCEEVWNPNSNNYIEKCLMPFTQIKGYTIGEYEAFLNKLNKCIEPWKNEFSFYAEEPNLEKSMENDSANILYDLDDMIVAVVKTIDGELRIVGTKL